MNSNRYLWDAADYAHHSSEQYAWAQDLITKLDLDGAETILDLGCGDGKITALLAERSLSGRVIGIDSDRSMVSLAKAKFDKDSTFGPCFIQMDAARLGFREAFDIVFSNAVLHWVHDHLAVLEGIFRSLVPGGFCLLQMGGQGNASQIIEVLDQIRFRPQWRDFFSKFKFPYHFYSVEEYRPFLQAAGLRRSRIELVGKNMQHHGNDGLAGWLRTAWLPYIEKIPLEFRDLFIAEVVDIYLRNFPPDAKGVVHVPMVRLEVQAYRD